MKRGFFSHQLCYGQSLYDKHIVYLTIDNRLDSVLPFRHETSYTIFCDGLLIAFSSAFAGHEEEFIISLTQQLCNNNSLTIGEAVLQNKIYSHYCIHNGEEIRLYTIGNIDWQKKRPYESTILKFQPVLIK